jgi:ferredoxin
MHQREFAGLVDEVAAYFQHAVPNEHTLEIWYDRVRKIPSSNIEWLTKRITQADAWPKNFPNLMWGLSMEWSRSHPEETKKGPDFGCRLNKPGEPDVCTDGYIIAWKYLDDIKDWNSYAFRCAECRRCTDACGIPEIGMYSLIEQGYQIETPVFDRSFGKQFGRRGNPDEMKDIVKIAQEIQEEKGW